MNIVSNYLKITSRVGAGALMLATLLSPGGAQASSNIVLNTQKVVYAIKDASNLVVCWSRSGICTTFTQAGYRGREDICPNLLREKNLVSMNEYLGGPRSGGNGYAAFETCRDNLGFLHGKLCVDVPPYEAPAHVFKRCSYVTEIADSRFNVSDIAN